MKYTHYINICLLSAGWVGFANADQETNWQVGVSAAEPTQTVSPDPYANQAIQSGALANNSLYAALVAGYLVDASEPYYLAELGYEFKNGVAIYAQANVMNLEFTGEEQDIQNFSLGLKYTQPSRNGKWEWSYGPSAGVSQYDVTITSFFTSISGEDSTYYFDLFARGEYAFNENVSALLGFRSIFRGDVDIFGTTLESGSDVGLEGGVIFRF